MDVQDRPVQGEAALGLKFGMVRLRFGYGLVGIVDVRGTTVRLEHLDEFVGPLGRFGRRVAIMPQGPGRQRDVGRSKNETFTVQLNVEESVAEGAELGFDQVDVVLGAGIDNENGGRSFNAAELALLDHSIGFGQFGIEGVDENRCGRG